MSRRFVLDTSVAIAWYLPEIAIDFDATVHDAVGLREAEGSAAFPQQLVNRLVHPARVPELECEHRLGRKDPEKRLEVLEVALHVRRELEEHRAERETQYRQRAKQIVDLPVALPEPLEVRDLLEQRVEEEVQRDFLVERGCREMQGFPFARPLPFDSLLGYIDNGLRPS